MVSFADIQSDLFLPSRENKRRIISEKIDAALSPALIRLTEIKISDAQQVSNLYRYLKIYSDAEQEIIEGDLLK